MEFFKRKNNGTSGLGKVEIDKKKSEINNDQPRPLDSEESYSNKNLSHR
jgi:hypothetical protein